MTPVQAPAPPPGPVMPDLAEDIELQVRREAMRFGMRGAGMSTALLPVVITMMLWPAIRGAWSGGPQALAQGAVVAVITVLALVTTLWRWHFIVRLRRPGHLDELGLEALRRLEREIAANAALSGLTWCIATFTLWPWLTPGDAALHAVILAGSSAMAAFFMSLIGRTLEWLILPMLLPLVVVSALGDPLPPRMALAALVFTGAVLKAARDYRANMQLSIRRGVEQQRAHAALRQARDAAEAAAAAKTRFVATMSHEIRTPMNGVLGALDLLARRPLEPEARHLLGVARTSGEGLMAVLDDVLDYARIDADHLTLQTVPLRPDELLQGIADLLRADAERRGLRLRIDRPAEPVPACRGDARRLQQVLLNLGVNALKFTPAGEVTLRLSLPGTVAGDATAGPDTLCLRFEVEDTGVGIADTEQALLFRPFSQVAPAAPGTPDAPSPAPGAAGGTGLGLAISQRLVGLMGSRIDVHSRPGLGSRFGFTLALPRADEAAVPRRGPVRHRPGDEASAPVAALPTPAPGFAPGTTVLLAEDNAVNRLIATGMLEALGLSVVCAEDGEQALACLKAQRIDLVLMDVRMPRLDGLAATRAWRTHEGREGRPRLPVVAMTAHADAELRAQALEAGLDDTLAKPCALEDLAAMLARWLPTPGARPAPRADA